MRRLLGSAVLSLFVFGFASSFDSAHGCATVWDGHKNTPVGIASESAIIVWDAGKKTQHFIRRASFTTAANDFGFLVPTPTKPELAEAEDEAFQYLAKVTEPKTVTKKRPTDIGCSIGCSDRGALHDKIEAKVNVLETKRVAGHDAAVLAANDAQALADWLKLNGYQYSPALKEWLEPYVAAGWIVTAFKYAREDGDTKQVASKAVRMTFKTEQPLFPYREPQPAADTGNANRLLRIFFLGDKRVKGELGSKGDAWQPGKTAWAGALNEEQRQGMGKLLSLPGGTPESWYLTEFEDASSPRPGTADVYFSTSDDQKSVERPPHVKYVSSVLPECVFCYGLAACMVVPRLLRHWRRRR